MLGLDVSETKGIKSPGEILLAALEGQRPLVLLLGPLLDSGTQTQSSVDGQLSWDQIQFRKHSMTGCLSVLSVESRPPF
jgi:hypothetical protein